MLEKEWVVLLNEGLREEMLKKLNNGLLSNNTAISAWYMIAQGVKLEIWVKTTNNSGLEQRSKLVELVTLEDGKLAMKITKHLPLVDTVKLLEAGLRCCYSYL